MKVLSPLFAALLLTGGSSALAQQFSATATMVRGTIEKVEDRTMTVKTREGPTMVVSFPPTVEAVAILKRSLSDIKVGTFVGSTSLRGDDRKLQAIEIHIFPERLRGRVPEMQNPGNLVPNAIQTTGVVTSISPAGSGTALKLKFKDQEDELVATPNTTVVTYSDPDPSVLKAGLTVFTRAVKKDDGSWSSEAIAIEKDGVKPPM